MQNPKWLYMHFNDLSSLFEFICIRIQRMKSWTSLNHRVITHRDVTDVPTFFVRMLRKLLEFTGIEYAIQDGGSPFKLAEHAQLIIFCQAT